MSPGTHPPASDRSDRSAPIAPITRWELYRLLAEPVRLRLMALAAEEELAVGELADLVGESQPNVSRHLSPLRSAGVLVVRRQGTWTLARLAPKAGDDPVVADALRAGRSLCERDGSLRRVADVVSARERSTREFFARGRDIAPPGPPTELAVYLSALAPLIPRRGIAVDAGTGDGRLLEVLSPLFAHVVAVDRSGAQLSAARHRVTQRGFSNVELVEGELDGSEVRKAVAKHSREGADLVIAARVLHHARKPSETARCIAALCRPGGAVAVIDYERHDDEALKQQQADLWMGFEPDELRELLRGAGLREVRTTAMPSAWSGTGPDRHLPWQVATALRPTDDDDTNHSPAAPRRGQRTKGTTDK